MVVLSLFYTLFTLKDGTLVAWTPHKFLKSYRMEHAHTHGMDDAVFEGRSFEQASLWQRAATALKRALQPTSAGRSLEAAEAVILRRCPAPYFNVGWKSGCTAPTERRVTLYPAAPSCRAQNCSTSRVHASG